jgi:hypothetical protein
LGTVPAIALGGSIATGGLSEMAHGGAVFERATENLAKDFLHAIDAEGSGTTWKDLHLEEKVQKSLEFQKVEPKTVESLAQKGVSPEELAEFVDVFRREYPHNAATDGEQLARMLDGLRSFGQSFEGGKELLRSTARLSQKASTQKAFKEVERVLDVAKELDASGSLTNPQELRKVLAKASVELGRAGRSGFAQELELALERVKQGHEVQLGKIYDHRRGLQTGGDIVDYTTKEVIQSKYLTTDDVNGFLKNIEKAAQQTMGKHQEFPPIDSKGREFKKVVEVRLDEILCKDLAKMSNSEVNSSLNEWINLHEGLENFDGLIRIRVGNEVKEFKIRKGTPGSSQPLK